MANYHAYLGRRVEVQYRAGDIFLPATGTLAADSGKSIFLEEHFVQGGKEKHFRWEIPYGCLLKIEEKPLETAPATGAIPPVRDARASKKPAAGADARDGRDSHSLVPMQNRPEEA